MDEKISNFSTSEVLGSMKAEVGELRRQLDSKIQERM
jgi:hypothetical protein